MFKYKIKIPLFVEQKSNFDKHDFSSNTNISFFIEKEYNHMNFVLKGEDGDYTIELWNLIFNNLDECIYSIEIFLKKLLPICSLLIQNQYSNQHYTHLRLDYNISKANILENIMIQPKEEKKHDGIIKVNDTVSFRDTLSMTSSFKVKLESITDFIDIFESNKDFRFLMDCYYRALGATDFITKYYNAFTAIEFIENQFTKCIETTSLLEGCVLDQIIINIEDSGIIRNANRERIVSRIKSTLKNATLESRAEKLLNILIKVFEIQYIKSGMIETEIDIDLVKKFIEIRNSLYHGKHFTDKEKEIIFKKGLELIVLIENILVKWKK